MNSFVFQTSDMPADQANLVWGGLKKGIQEIQNGNASKLRFEELYRNAYTLVLHKHGDLLYEGVSKTIRDKLDEVFVVVSGATVEALLETLVTEWERHRLIMTMIRDVLMYMDKTYCVRNKKTLIYDLGLEMFRDMIVKKPAITGRLQTVLLQLVAKEREHELINRHLMKSCLSMLVEININSKALYQEEFENNFLKETRIFYDREVQTFLATNTVQDYLKKIETRLTEEEDRSAVYLDESTKRKLLNVVEEEVITRHAEALVKNPISGAVPMFVKDMFDDLKRFYKLFTRVPAALTALREGMRGFVKETGEKIVSDEENKKNPHKFVQEVLNLRTKYFKIVSVSFNEDRKFSRALKEAFEHFINLDARAAQFLSLYIDEMMKAQIKDLTEDLAEQKLDEVVTIFRYLSDKDVFEDFYKQHLAGRLLMGKGLSDDMEKHMIAKLKAECGHQFTSKMEAMFKNIDLSKEINEQFQKYLSSLPEVKGEDLPDVSVNVLTSGIWPFQHVGDCQMPKPVQTRMEQFKKFYLGKHAGHRLTWQTSLGSANVLCDFTEGPKEFQVHTYQMCILYLYNEAESFTFSQIQELTQIPDAELQRHLLSLAHPKIKILSKEPNVKKCEPTDTYTYNAAFTNKQYRIKVMLLGPQTATDDPSAVPEDVIEARKNRVEAAVVRIMKFHKRLDHTSLVSEVVKQLAARFPADPTFIKKRIESLIEREYLQRDKADRKIYEYLA